MLQLCDSLIRLHLNAEDLSFEVFDVDVDFHLNYSMILLVGINTHW
jgi:hypothetical protein